jgi:hypothetical protein
MNINKSNIYSYEVLIGCNINLSQAGIGYKHFAWQYKRCAVTSGENEVQAGIGYVQTTPMKRVTS